jgi:glycine hydroxymethyltransferase
MIGKDFDQVGPDGKRTLEQVIQKKVFPFFQGAPNQSSIAAKARGLAYVATPEFNAVARRVVDLSQALAQAFMDKGYRVITGGTDNHIVVVDVMSKGISGVNAEKALEDCGLVVNKNRIPYDQKPPSITSGIRLGTNGLAIRRMEPADMVECVDLIHEVLASIEQVSDKGYKLAPELQARVEKSVRQMCQRRPISTYPAPATAYKAA